MGFVSNRGGERREMREKGVKREKRRGKREKREEKRIGPTCHVDATLTLNGHFNIV